ncbi:MAG: hypothetical protein JWM02_930 [Frankiales bacterium]|nr:hypothetical protein [Frankiales bacterium]
MAENLTPEEDAVLRRLHWFEQFGAELSPARQFVKASIRERDKRTDIREPDEAAPVDGAVEDQVLV